MYGQVLYWSQQSENLNWNVVTNDIWVFDPPSRRFLFDNTVILKQLQSNNARVND